jgi:hypothetical protein
VAGHSGRKHPDTTVAVSTAVWRAGHRRSHRGTVRLGSQAVWAHRLHSDERTTPARRKLAPRQSIDLSHGRPCLHTSEYCASGVAVRESHASCVDGLSDSRSPRLVPALRTPKPPRDEPQEHMFRIRLPLDMIHRATQNATRRPLRTETDDASRSQCSIAIGRCGNTRMVSALRDAD